jgi:hypothetical protein
VSVLKLRLASGTKICREYDLNSLFQKWVLNFLKTVNAEIKRILPHITGDNLPLLQVSTSSFTRQKA